MNFFSKMLDIIPRHIHLHFLQKDRREHIKSDKERYISQTGLTIVNMIKILVLVVSAKLKFHCNPSFGPSQTTTMKFL